MSSKIKFLLFFSFISFCATAQVKIGQNPNTIHSASIVELESTDKAFVLTRLSTAQMQAITPLNGAVVYNTDTQCVHYFNGTVWTNLCDGINTNDFSFIDNGDGTITLDDGNGNTITFNGAAQTISTLIDNGDGTYTYTNENGIETVISIAVTDNQNLQTDNTPGNISIDNGNALTINVDDADADAQNEIQTLDYTSGVLTLSNDPNATVVDLSAFDQNAADDFSGSFNDLSDLPINLDTDATDDFNTAITFDGTNLTVSDAGGDVSTDISGLAYDDTALRADVDQNTADIDALEAEQTTQNTNIATNATDIDNLEAEQTTQNNSIATNATDISTNIAAIAAHNTADGDLSDSNEYNTGISFDGTDLTVTDLGGDQTVDISGLAYDDSALRTDVDQNTADIDALEAEQTIQNNSIATNATDIDNLEAEQTTQNNSIATNATDIDNLEVEQTTQNNSIATNATDIDNLETEQTTQNNLITTNATDISTNTAAIAAHNTADGDLSDSNEYNTGISFDGTDLTVTDLGGDQSVDISGLAYDDTALRADVDQNTADIDALETEQITQNNSIATNASDISTNAAAIAAHNSADGDLSDSNEYNTGISFDGTDLTVTDLGGDQTVDISGLAYDDTALRADVDQNTADIDALEAEQTTQNTNIATNASDIDNLEAEQTTQNNSIATNATDIDALEAEQTTQNNSIATNATDISTNAAAIAAHNSADGDLSDSNEYNTGISFNGTDLTVTDLGGDQTVDISGLAYDDTALRADVDQNTADIDALETEQTTQDNSIATNATDIDALEAEQTTQNNTIATNATDIDNLEAEQTTQNNSIATNATDISTNTAAIAAHNTADGDLSDSNEYNTGIGFDGTELTVTDLGGDQTVDISGLAYDDTALRADVDQNTADIDVLEAEQTIQNNSIATNATDIDNLETEQTTQKNSIATNASDIDALEAEQTTQNNSIATNATDIDNLEAEQTTQNNSISSNSAAIAAHNTADEDLSATNETNTSFSTVDVAGTDYLRISDSNGDLDVPLSDLSHTGTTGSVFFAGADGTPTENNGQLFWNSSSNSLGVGTSSPTNKLHVSGAIRSQGILNSNGTENEPAYRFNDDTNTGMFRPAADEIAFTVGGIEAMKIEETSSDTSVIINETLELEGAILDENDSPGTAGQVLTSTATGTEWVNSMSPIKAIGKISAAGGVTKATAGVTVTRISVGYYRVTLPTGAVSDADYIIQLTQPGRGGAGNDDPGISYSNQTATSFEVIIGDNDNGGTDRSRFDSEFMFTVLDL
ncbi:beta strand repeat-containing protein [Maribacter dokdonensis]|uniref:beta strand repeat-containing protein n=1 Tax=Maribacter dokdonensis TaxID=320912 RepID=UPI0032994079